MAVTLLILAPFGVLLGLLLLGRRREVPAPSQPAPRPVVQPREERHPYDHGGAVKLGPVPDREDPS